MTLNNNLHFKIASLNVAGIKGWTDRLPKIVDVLNSQELDILCLQEVRFDVCEGVSQADQLNRLLHTPSRYVSADIVKRYETSTGEIYREGLAIMSRLPIITTETIVLDKAPDDKHHRYVQFIDLEKADESIMIAHVHFSNNQHSVSQLKEVLSILEKRGEERIIIGDFNILDIGDIRREATDYKISYDHTAYVSFPREGITLDYALLPDSFRLMNVTTSEGLSDHAMVCFEVGEEDRV